MAHDHQLRFIEVVTRHLAPEWTDTDILEIGSYDVNGSIRQFFEGSRYIGIDLTEGPGVDRVCEGSKLDYPDGSFDICISCECFEHNPQWSETFQNMCRMTKPGGIVLFTCASTGRLEHGTVRTSPGDSPGTQSVGSNYYQNLREVDFRRIPNFTSRFATPLFIYNKYSSDLYFAAMKKGAIPIFHFDPELLKCDYELAKEETEKQLRARLSGGSAAKALLRNLTRLPLRGVAAVSTDAAYQNFAFRYLHWLEIAKKRAFKILHSDKAKLM